MMMCILSSPAECFGLVMNQLVSDLSAQDNLNQPGSEATLLPPICHHDDLLLVSPTLHDTEHRHIEKLVRCFGCWILMMQADK